MRVPKPIKYSQPVFWETGKRITRVGAFSYYLGEACEELVACLVDGHRLPACTDYEICPDLLVYPEQWKGAQREVYVECKASGKNRQLILYGERVVKDYRFRFENKASIYFAICEHGLQWKDKEQWDTDVMASELALTLRRIIILDTQDVYRLLDWDSMRVVNNGQREGKLRDGWTIQTSRLVSELCNTEHEVSFAYKGRAIKTSVVTLDSYLRFW